ncbi:MAG: DsbA family oxidoreductase [Candidatus Methanomethylophilaceae archaeon]|nr:DsbA family oxidoreductase [Candidatus Methanomethylophilaceae archaeon]
MRIFYWSDFGCPFCYIAEVRMKKALAELGIENETRIDFRAFELNPNARKVPVRNVVEGFARHYGCSIEQAQMQVDRIEAMGRGEGLIFRYGSARNSNTFDALRLTKLAQSKGYKFGSEFVERMYKAYFEDNLVMADHDVLRKIAADAGMDSKEVDDLLIGDMYADEVRRDEFEAHQLGIDAVPFFVINDKYGIPGAVDIRDMKRVLMKAYSEEESEPIEPGMVCGPDGCHPAEKK